MLFFSLSFKGVVLLSFYGAELIVITTYGNSWPIILIYVVTVHGKG